MAVTILQRPEGYILGGTATDTVGADNSGDVIFGAAAHGLTAGQIVYLVTNVEEYNGFFEVGTTSTDSFRILSLETGDQVEFINDATGVFYVSELTHGWSAVHLPITYRLESDLYPTNSVDTVRNINSVQDANGYSALQLSGSLGTVHTYDFIEITVPNDTGLSGVYQIIEYISDTVILINLLYDSSNNFTSATAQKVYNNYNIVVRIYAGLNASHQWTAQKPYELIATLELTPEDDNTIFFSINEYLKKHIETRNNLVLGTLPNNLDFWTMFYIEVAESYDDSDGYTFGTYTSSFTSDQTNFEGYAVNAKLEFKNIYSGYLSEYLMTNNTAKFLTLFTIPVLFSCGDDTPNCYQDISFINPTRGIDLFLTQEFYDDGNLGTTVNTQVDDADEGLLRVPIEDANCSYDRVDLTVRHNATAPALSTFVNGAVGTAWILGATPNVVLIGADNSTFLRGSFIGVLGITYTVNYDITMSGGGVNSFFQILFLDASFASSGGSATVILNNGVNTGSLTLSSNTNISFVAVSVGNSSGTDTYTLNSLSVDDVVISETKEFKIDCGCAQQEIRLTWLNNLGGFDYWAFTAKKDHIVEIREVMETKKNIFPTWPKSYGADADTIRKQTSRVSNKSYTVRSQYMTQDEADAVSYIKSSVLVQIINSRYDRRTVIVDPDSFVKYQDRDKTYSVSFNISFTDDIPSQTV